MKLALIVNPSAGGGRAARSLEAVEATLRSYGLEHSTHLTEGLDHARQLARRAAQAGETAVAFGGDGLVGAVAGALAGGEGVLGVLPGGRGNDFARTLAIPLEPLAACEVLRSGVPRALDLGEAGGRMFVGIASCGFDSEANRIANATRLVRGPPVYFYGALRALVAWQPACFRVVLDGVQTVDLRGYSVAAANSKAYGGGMLLAPNASLQDGRLDIVMTAHVPKWRFLARSPTVFKGEYAHQEGVSVLRAAEVRVSADRPFSVYADGDVIAELPVTLRALPAAVRVIVPS